MRSTAAGLAALGLGVATPQAAGAFAILAVDIYLANTLNIAGPPTLLALGLGLAGLGWAHRRR